MSLPPVFPAELATYQKSIDFFLQICRLTSKDPDYHHQRAETSNHSHTFDKPRAQAETKSRTRGILKAADSSGNVW
jgi:hypothetical protein